MDLLTLVALCGPLVHPQTTLSVITVESSGQPFAIHDNTDNRTYDASTVLQGAAVAKRLIRAGHRIDVGLMQINYDAWLKPTGFAVEWALDPCTNVRLGTTILSANYAQALHTGNVRHDALNRALSLYNSGTETRSLIYANTVLQVAAMSHSPRANSRTGSSSIRTLQPGLIVRGGRP